MKAILKPISHPELGQIIIEECLFPIGRSETPFSSYDNSIVTELSRRHARIFQEDGAIYLVDLGSLNGTRLNGDSVQKKPIKLRNDDEICFANLCYAVEIAERAEIPTLLEEVPPSFQLVLVSNRVDIGVETIVVTQFPFLISREGDAFLRYKDNFPKEIKYISRRHALIFVKDNNPYVEDLGSINGTFINGVRLEEHAVLLRDGDLIAFGGDHFYYTVKLEKEEVVAASGNQTLIHQRAEYQGVVIAEPRTTFINTANSFLDIFCQQDNVEGNEDQILAEKIDKSFNDSSRNGNIQGPITHRRVTLLDRIRAFLVEFKGIFKEEKSANFRRIWLVIGIGILFVVIGIYLRGTSEREIKDLLDKERYLESAALANQYLKEHSENERISALATEALVKSIVPQWIEQLNNKDFVAADALLGDAEDLSQFNSDGLRMLGLLEWISQLERFFTERGGAEAPIVIFKHEDQINALIEWWDADDPGNRHLLIRILRYVPAFEDIYSRTFSQLRMLNNERSVYIKAITELQQTIQAKLNADQAEDLVAVFKNFEERYPRIRGMERVWADLNDWIAIREAIRTKNLSEALHLGSDIEFLTPPFQDKAQDHIVNALPPPDIIREYQTASEAWIAGNTDLALAILQSLAQKAWGEAAMRKLERYQTVVKDFQSLKTMENAQNYGERIVAFYSTLDSTEDVFFLQAMEADFQIHKQIALKNAEELLKSAGEDWNAYRANGGIGGLLRLERVISESFKQQAQLLTQAANHITRGIRVYDLLQLNYPSGSKELHDEILSEVRRQRQWLNDMRIVLEPSLLERKLQLFPVP